MRRKVILGGVVTLKVFFSLTDTFLDSRVQLKKFDEQTAEKKFIHIAACNVLIKKFVERKAEKAIHVLIPCAAIEKLIKLMQPQAISRQKCFSLDRHFLVSCEQLQRFFFCRAKSKKILLI